MGVGASRHPPSLSLIQMGQKVGSTCRISWKTRPVFGRSRQRVLGLRVRFSNVYQDWASDPTDIEEEVATASRTGHISVRFFKHRKNPNDNFEPNTQVRYKADPSVSGWVISITGENARVFIEGSPRLVPIGELEPAAGLRKCRRTSSGVALTRRRLEHPVTDQFLSYRASKTKLMYHQFLPVKKMLESPDQRLLIADEVGTGKTIEAGLIWAELESRAGPWVGERVIICPKALVGKWSDEMSQRFGSNLRR